MLPNSILRPRLFDFVEDAAVALGRVLGPQDEDVGRVLDLAVGVEWRLVDQGDALVARMLGIDFALGLGDHALVGADLAERRAIGERFTLLYVKRYKHSDLC